MLQYFPTLKQRMSYKYTVLASLYTILIVFLSSIPDFSLSGYDSLAEQVFSNLAHIPAYGLLTVLWLKAFDRRTEKPFAIGNVLILLGVMLFAVSDEIHQSFVHGRSSSLVDLGLDLLGILLGLWMLKLLDNSRSQKAE